MDVATHQTHRHDAHMRDQVFSVCRTGGRGKMEWNFSNPQRDGKGEGSACSPKPGMLELQGPLGVQVR